MNDLPEISLKDALREPVYIYLKAKDPYLDGELPLADLHALLSLLSVSRPMVILEIGTYYGWTTLKMAETCPDASVHTLDLPRDYSRLRDIHADIKDDFHLIDGSRRAVGHYFRLDGFGLNIVQHFGDSKTWDWKSVDASFVFIDGSHTYEYTVNDSLHAYEMIRFKPNGTIVWHDVDEGHPAVIKGLVDFGTVFNKLSIRRITGTRLAYLQMNYQLTA